MFLKKSKPVLCVGQTIYKIIESQNYIHAGKISKILKFERGLNSWSYEVKDDEGRIWYIFDSEFIFEGTVQLSLEEAQRYLSLKKQKELKNILTETKKAVAVAKTQKNKLYEFLYKQLDNPSQEEIDSWIEQLMNAVSVEESILNKFEKNLKTNIIGNAD